MNNLMNRKQFKLSKRITENIPKDQMQKSQTEENFKSEHHEVDFMENR